MSPKELLRRYLSRLFLKWAVYMDDDRFLGVRYRLSVQKRFTDDGELASEVAYLERSDWRHDWYNIAHFYDAHEGRAHFANLLESARLLGAHIPPGDIPGSARERFLADKLASVM